MADETSELDNVDQIDSELSSVSEIDSDLTSESDIDSELGAITEVSITYTGVETDDIIVTTTTNPATISAELQKMWYQTTDDFPAIGSSNMLYVDIETGSLYIYDAENAVYQKIITDWRDIEEINGGEA